MERGSSLTCEVYGMRGTVWGRLVNTQSNELAPSQSGIHSDSLVLPIILLQSLCMASIGPW